MFENNTGKTEKKIKKNSKKALTSNSFKTRNYSKKWTEKETKLFYRCLSIFGTDFSMIALIFKGRTRNQIINKFHKEERGSSAKVEESLQAHKKCDTKIVKKYRKMFENINIQQQQQQLMLQQERKNSNASGSDKVNNPATEIQLRNSRYNSINSVNSLDSVDQVINFCNKNFRQFTMS